MTKEARGNLFLGPVFSTVTRLLIRFILATSIHLTNVNQYKGAKREQGKKDTTGRF